MATELRCRGRVIWVARKLSSKTQTDTDTHQTNKGVDHVGVKRCRVWRLTGLTELDVNFARDRFTTIELY